VRVIIVGAGIIGVAVADALAVGGADVTVLDMRSPGRGASHASAGMLAPYTEAHGDASLLDLCVRSLSLFDSCVSELSAATGRAIEYARTGTLEVAFDPDAAGRLAAAKQDLDARGVAADLLDPARLRVAEPAVSPAALAGLLTGVHGFVGVDSLLGAMAHRARFSGASFESPVEAVAVEDRGDTVEVEAGGQLHAADAVVIAAGAWSGRVRIRNVPALPLRPVRGQLLQLRGDQGKRPGRIVWGPRCYTVPWSDGSLLVGATVEDADFDESATVAGVRDLTSATAELLPSTAGAGLLGVRVGLRPALPDGLPAIGRFARAPRVVAATGHFRNGVLLAPLTAAIVRRCLLDGVEDETVGWLSPDRFVSRRA
jgi:glycine oxidase